MAIEWSAEDRRWFERHEARLRELVEQRLAEYRRTGVYVFDMFIAEDDDSTDGPPNRWVALDHDTGELIQRVPAEELDDFYAQHPDWVEYTGMVDELNDQAKDEMTQEP
jgi:hypothetical protein